MKSFSLTQEAAGLRVNKRRRSCIILFLCLVIAAAAGTAALLHISGREKTYQDKDISGQTRVFRTTQS